MAAGPLQITSDEVNCLIYAYFQDSGFSHSAFTILHEAQIQRSPYLAKHIPRGELISLLGKALLYLEVESHWRQDAETVACEAGFSLLEPHICSVPPKPTLAALPVDSVSAPQEKRSATRSAAKAQAPLTVAPESSNKRKQSPLPSAGPSEKRPKVDSEKMDVDPKPPKTTSTKIVKAKPRSQGPGDDKTDPRSVLLLNGHNSEVFVAQFNPVYYETLGTGSKDATVNLWRLPKPPQRVDAFITSALQPVSLGDIAKGANADLTALHWSPDGNLLAFGSYDSVFRICDRKGNMYFQNELHEGPIFAVRFSKNGRWCLTASLDGTAAVWDVHERKLHRQYNAHRDCCLDIDWLSDDTFASAGADRRINIIKLNKDEPIKVLEGHGDEVNQIRANPSGTRLASCSDDWTARIWRVDNISSTSDTIPGLASSDNVVVLEGHAHSVSIVGWCPKTPTGTHELVATASFDSKAKIWDSVTGQCIHTFSDHTKPIYAMAFSPNGDFFSTGGGDGWFNVYSMKTYERKWSWYAGTEKPGVFEIDWQNQDGVNRVALALESNQVAVVDISKIAALGTPEYVAGSSGMSQSGSFGAPY